MVIRVLAIVLGLAAASCSKSQPAPAPAQASEKPAAAKYGQEPAKAKQMVAGGALVLDVRTPDEFKSGHLTMALNMPVHEIDDYVDSIAQITDNDKAKPIVVYCESGDRAQTAKKRLDGLGYTNVVNGGGLDDLK